MTSDAVLAIDAGTTGTRAAWVDASGSAHGLSYERIQINYSAGGVVEQDANVLLERTVSVAREAISHANASGVRLLSMAIAAQRLTGVLWDTSTGRAVVPAMVWQDNRYKHDLQDLSTPWEERSIAESGRRPGSTSAHYWAARQIEQSQVLTTLKSQGRLAFGTVDTWLVWSLTNERRLLTSSTHLSSTDAYMLKSNEYRYEWIDVLGFPRDLLPTICRDVDDFGTSRADLIGASLPISVVIGDQQGAAIGLRNLTRGQASCVHGTGSFIDINTGNSIATCTPKSVSSVPYVGYLTRTAQSFLAENLAPTTGAALDWICNTLGLFSSASEINHLASTVQTDTGILVNPALMGLYSPEYEPRVKVSISGLSGSSTRAELAHGVLAGVAHSISDAVDALVEMSRTSINRVTVGGGLSASDVLMQMQADFTGLPHYRDRQADLASLRGAAFLAGVDSGLWTDLSETSANDAYDEFLPRLPADQKARLRAEWRSRLESEIAHVRR